MPRPTKVVMRAALASEMRHAHCSGALMKESNNISMDSAVQHRPAIVRRENWKGPMPTWVMASSTVYVADGLEASGRTVARGTTSEFGERGELGWRSEGRGSVAVMAGVEVGFWRGGGREWWGRKSPDS